MYGWDNRISWPLRKNKMNDGPFDNFGFRLYLNYMLIGFGP